MAKVSNRNFSPYTLDSVEFLGNLIREARIDKRMTVAELAERVGVSRGLVGRAEHGDMNCSIGAVFEMACVLGISLFELSEQRMSRELHLSHEKLTLLPKHVRKVREVINDDF